MVKPASTHLAIQFRIFIIIRQVNENVNPPINFLYDSDLG